MWTRSTWNTHLVANSPAVKGDGLRLWLTWLIALGVWLIVSSTVYVWLQVQRVNLGYQLAELQSKQEQYLAVQRKLQLEYNRWREPFHLEELGRQHFSLSAPRDNQRIVSR